MAPKKEPKAVVKVKEEIKKAGDELTEESVRKYIDQMDCKSRGTLFDSMRYALNVIDGGVKFKDYNDIKGDDLEARRHWLACYILDPSMSTFSATNTTIVAQDNIADEEAQWLTESEYAGPKGINDTKLAAIAIVDFESRPHSTSKSLRAAGVLEYKIVTDKTINRKRNSSEAMVSASMSSLDADEYEEVKQAMDKNSPPTTNPTIASGEPPKVEPLPIDDNKKKTKKTKKEEVELTEADKVKAKEALTQKQQLTDLKTRDDKDLKQIKTFVDKTRNDLKDVQIIKNKLLGKAGWGQGAAQFLQTKTDEELVKVLSQSCYIYIYTHT